MPTKPKLCPHCHRQIAACGTWIEGIKTGMQTDECIYLERGVLKRRNRALVKAAKNQSKRIEELEAALRMAGVQ